jgi:tetratricopeptide (TPR) repeat protein
MAKIGRNDPCPCGSGKKYKRCCLEKDETAAAAAREAARAAAAAASMASTGEFSLEEADELTEASNAIVDLVHAGKLDEAEQAAHEFLRRFPEVHDGYDRLGMVYEARGDNQRAAECYRKVLAFVAEHPRQYDPEFADTFHKLVARLDPPTPT